MTDPLGGGTPHVDPDVLADLQEGLLDGPAADAATAHLADCPTCRGDLAALDEVRDLLAGAPDVGPVPADLVDRLDLALAGAAAEPALSVASTTVVPLRAPETKGPRGMRVLQMAAVLVLIFAGGALGVSALLNAGGGSSEDAGTTASERRRRLERLGRRGHVPGNCHRPRLDARGPARGGARARQRRPRSGSRRPARFTAGDRRRLDELRKRRGAQPLVRRRAGRPTGGRPGPGRLRDRARRRPGGPGRRGPGQLRGPAGGGAAAAHPGRSEHGGCLRREARAAPRRVPPLRPRAAVLSAAAGISHP